MSDRDYPNRVYTQGTSHVYLPVTIIPQGTGTPLLSEGDPNGSYFTISRAGVGSILLTTKDTFLAVVKVGIEVNSGAAVKCGQPVQNTNKTWSVPIYTIGTTSSVALGAGTVTAGGTGYTSAPAIAYNNAHGNVGLKGFTTIAAGAVTAITITDGGFGTDGTAPTITLTGGGGTGATATVALGTITAQDLPTAAAAQIRVDLVLRNSSVLP